MGKMSAIKKEKKGTKGILNQNGNREGLIELSYEQSKRLKQILLEMCSDIFEVCNNYDLTCMLSGGSALGAVRHGGFIPWDDDIDLNIPREDYDKFADIFLREKGDKYDVFVPDGKHKVSTTFMKVSKRDTVLIDAFHAGTNLDTGIDIDIFPIEYAPDNLVARKIRGNAVNVMLRSVVSVYYFQNRSEEMKKLFSGSTKTRIIYSIRCALGCLLSFRSWEWWFVRFNDFSRYGKKTGHCTIPTGSDFFRELHPTAVFFPARKCTFEGIEVFIENDADTYLSALYGDYMKIPPVEKREKHFYVKAVF